MEKTLRNVVLLGAFLLPFIFFIVPGDMFFPFITGKNFAFRVIVEMMFGAWAALAILSPAYRPKKSLILIALSAFVAIVALADMFGDNFFRSFWSNYERMEGLITLLHLLALCIVLSAVLQTRALFEKLFDTSIVASVLMSLYGLAQFFGTLATHQGATRLDGTFGNATYFAVYALFHIFIAALLSLRGTKRWQYLWYGIAILLNLFVLYNTATRGAMIGLLAGLIVFGAVSALKGSGRARIVAVGMIAGVIVFVGGFIALKDTQFIRGSPVLGRFASISLSDTTTQSRFIIWGMALQGFKERPLLGWGQDNFITVFNTYYKPELYKQEPFFDRAHNVFLDWLIAGGALGLLAYLSLFGAAALAVFRSKIFSALEASVLLGLLAAYFTQNLFVFDNSGSYILFVMILGYIAVVATTNNQEQVTKNKKEIAVGLMTTQNRQITLAACLIGTLFVLYAVNVKPFLANKALIQAMVPQKEGVLKNIAFFEKALAYNTFGTSEIREQVTQIAASIISSGNVPDDIKRALDALVRREMTKATERKDDARAEILFGSYLHRVGAYDDAILHITHARTLSPGKQQIAVLLGSVYLSKGDTQTALAIMKEAYDLLPENPNTRDAYALAAIHAGNRPLAEELLIPAYGTIAVLDDRFTAAFARRGDYQTVIAIWKTRIAEANARGEDSAQFHISLGSAYVAAGNRVGAVSELRKAILLDPKFKDQGEYLIREIEAGRNP